MKVNPVEQFNEKAPLPRGTQFLAPLKILVYNHFQVVFFCHKFLTSSDDEQHFVKVISILRLFIEVQK